MIFGKSLGKSLAKSLAGEEPTRVINAIKFEFPGGSGSILQHLSEGAGGAGEALEKSEDGITWSDFYPGRGISGGFTEVYVRGKCGSTSIAGLCGTYTKVSGDIRTLVDWENPKAVTLSANQFYNASSTRGLFQSYGESYNDLVDASGLILPSSLSASCFKNMFYGCIKLTAAPDLPATTLTNNCYENMFYGCSQLNEIHCAATNISANSCTTDWLKSVSASGDFYGKAAASWTTGDSGIPSGWTAHLD